MIVIPKPSEKITERFKKIIGIDPNYEAEKVLMSTDHCCALINVETGLDDFKTMLHYTERLYAGFWRFDGRWVRRKRHDNVNIGIKAGERVFCFSGERLSNVLKVVGKSAHLYICRRGDEDGFLLVLSERCGIALAPVVTPETYNNIFTVAELVDATEGGCDHFLDKLSDMEAERLVERLSSELGILHM